MNLRSLSLTPPSLPLLLPPPRQKQVSENVFIEEKRSVLLCEGKLCLRVLQELFNMQVVEMLHGEPHTTRCTLRTVLLPFLVICPAGISCVLQGQILSLLMSR